MKRQYSTTERMPVKVRRGVVVVDGELFETEVREFWTREHDPEEWKRACQAGVAP